jgi:hypothetical protein
MAGDITPFRSPDTHFNTDKISTAKQRNNIAHAIVTAMTTIRSDSQATEGQIQIIENNNQIPRGYPKGFVRRIDAGAAAVHKGLRQQNTDLFTGYATDSVNSLIAFFFQRNMVPFSNPFGHLKPGIVAGSGVLITRISQPDQ